MNLFLKGLAMGAANVVPGVSGGTVAFILGVYPRLITALKNLDLDAFKLLLKKDWSGFSKKVDFIFLLKIGLGVLVSLFTLAKLLEVGMHQYPVYVAALFFGLVLASIWAVGKLIKNWNGITISLLLFGFLLAVGLDFLPQAKENSNFLYLMLCGAAAMASMLVPGLSGSFILLLMGNYSYVVIQGVNTLRSGEIYEAGKILMPVGVGAVLGLLVLSRVLSWLFEKHFDKAVSLITGFITGSLLIIWPWKTAVDEIIVGGEAKVFSYQKELPVIDSSFIISICWLLLGAAMIVSLEKLRVKEGA